jgi:hypothetical protein
MLDRCPTSGSLHWRDGQEQGAHTARHYCKPTIYYPVPPTPSCHSSPGRTKDLRQTIDLHKELHKVSGALGLPDQTMHCSRQVICTRCNPPNASKSPSLCAWLPFPLKTARSRKQIFSFSQEIADFFCCIQPVALERGKGLTGSQT